MKKIIACNYIAAILVLCSLINISCQEEVSDDKGVVQCVEVADQHNLYKKKYKVDVKITLKSGYAISYTLYTDKSYRVGDSIFIK